MGICGKDSLFIISGETKKVADFSGAADKLGLLWQSNDGQCLCINLPAARQMAAQLLARLCFGPWEQSWLSELARRRYQCFDDGEMELLLEKTTLLTKEDDFCWGLFAGPGRKERLASAFSRHLRHYSRLDLNGFWRFRLEGYREYLQTLLTIAADEVLWEQEDNKYTLLLSAFMDARPPGGDVHVFLLRQGIYDICDIAGDGLRFVEGGRLAGCEDMLLCTLVQLAPARLTLHLEQPLPSVLYQLLRQLFGQRLHLETLYSPALLDKQQPQ